MPRGVTITTRLDGFICLVPNYWGWGETKDEAIKACRKAAPAGTSLAKGKRAIYELPMGSENPHVDPMGRICWDWLDTATATNRPGVWIEEAR